LASIEKRADRAIGGLSLSAASKNDFLALCWKFMNTWESDNVQPIFVVSGWGERFPLRFKCELEFGLDGYSGILTKELEAIENMIEGQGIGKKGEKYVGSVLLTPMVKRTDERTIAGSPPLQLPQWRLRYAPAVDKNPKNFAILRSLVDKWTRVLRPRIWLTIYKQAWTMEWILGRLGLFGEISKPVQVKWLIGRCLKRLGFGRFTRNADWPVGEVSDFFPASGLRAVLRGTKRLVCASHGFWRNNRKLVKRTMPWGSCELLTVNEKTAIDMGDAVRVPLRLYEMSSFEAWAHYHAIDCSPGTLLVIDREDLDRAVELLKGEPLSRLKILLVSQDLPDEATSHWDQCTPIADGLWLLQGPLSPHLRTLRPEQSSHNWPRISVVTVSYNQARYIKSCLDSVLDQGYPNLEYIVVDGGSTDGTREILERYRERLSLLIMEPDNGQSDALNKGFRSATGDVMNWLCSDDLLEPGSLFNIGRAFAHNEADLIAGGCRIINGRDKTLYRHHNGLPFDQVVDLSFGDLLSFVGVWQRGMYFFQPEVFFSRKIWEASGGYIKEHLHFAMDYDLFLRMAMAGAKILHIPHYVGVSRIHEDQKTRHEDKLYLPTIRALLEEYRRLIDRTGEVLIRKIA
jgi:GT2 family glycosyltransferase